MDRDGEPETFATHQLGEPESRLAITEAKDDMLHALLKEVLQLFLPAKDISPAESRTSFFRIHIVDEPENLVVVSQTDHVGDHRSVSRSAPDGQLFFRGATHVRPSLMGMDIHTSPVVASVRRVRFVRRDILFPHRLREYS